MQLRLLALATGGNETVMSLFADAADAAGLWNEAGQSARETRNAFSPPSGKHAEKAPEGLVVVLMRRECGG